MNNLLFIARVAYEMTRGYSTPASILEAANTHDRDIASWKRASLPIISQEIVGEIEQEPLSMRQFFTLGFHETLADLDADQVRAIRLALVE